MSKYHSVYKLNYDDVRNFYQTPYSVTRQLLNYMYLNDNGKGDLEYLFDKNKLVLEPFCGELAIVNILKDLGYNVVYSDIKEDIELNIKSINFFDIKDKFPQIISNPPFNNTNDIILYCKEICTEKFALLLPLNYLHGKERYYNIWSDRKFPLKHVLVFTRYILLTEFVQSDGKYSPGMIAYAWYIWDKSYTGYPLLDFLDNNLYIDH